MGPRLPHAQLNVLRSNMNIGLQLCTIQFFSVILRQFCITLIAAISKRDLQAAMLPKAPVS